MPALPARLRRIGKYALAVLGVVAGLAAIPILWTESACRSTQTANLIPFRSALAPADRREEVNTYLTYPEWSIVHAYEDLAGVTRRGSESDFAYFGSIGNYWSSLCSLTRLASSRGSIALDYKVMLYTIGISFTAEMAAKGAYELTIGRLTAWIRGPRRTPEDEFALAVAEEYAAFLRQTPWYEFPFATRLWQFWARTPLLGGNPIRKVERRLGLSIEYAAKAGYAKVIALGAGATPAPLRIRSVVTGLDVSDLAADNRISLAQTLANGASVIETPRYRVFTEIVSGLAARQRNIIEIAGNDDVLITVLTPSPAAVGQLGTQLFEVPVQARPGWRRIGLDVRVASLTSIIRQLRESGMELEHVYDY